jgi:hypothetical protein
MNRMSGPFSNMASDILSLPTGLPPIKPQQALQMKRGTALTEHVVSAYICRLVLSSWLKLFLTPLQTPSYTLKMLGTSVLLLTLAATGLAQAPEGYRAVYITSNVDPKFVIVPKARTSGSTTIVKTFNDTPEQQWYLQDGATKIQLADSTLCMDGGAQSNWKDLGNIYVNECAETESQNWFVMEDGRIALVPSDQKQCVDLLYMRATENNPVGLYSCAGLGNTGAADKGINWPLVNVTAE